MARMRLLRLPTEKELENELIEPHTFLNAFNRKLVSNFIAEVKDEGDSIDLDGGEISKAADWFVVED